MMYINIPSKDLMETFKAEVEANLGHQTSRRFLGFRMATGRVQVHVVNNQNVKYLAALAAKYLTTGADVFEIFQNNTARWVVSK